MASCFSFQRSFGFLGKATSVYNAWSAGLRRGSDSLGISRKRHDENGTNDGDEDDDNVLLNFCEQ